MKMTGSLRGTDTLTRAFLWFLLPAVAAGMQLPPAIEADRHLVRAERAIEEQAAPGEGGDGRDSGAAGAA